jgi:hypothetical protein
MTATWIGISWCNRPTVPVGTSAALDIFRHVDHGFSAPTVLTRSRAVRHSNEIDAVLSTLSRLGQDHGDLSWWRESGHGPIQTRAWAELLDHDEGAVVVIDVAIA